MSSVQSGSRSPSGSLEIAGEVDDGVDAGEVVEPDVPDVDGARRPGVGGGSSPKLQSWKR